MTTKVETFNVNYDQKTTDKVYDYGEPGVHPAHLYEYHDLADGVQGFAAVGEAQIAQFRDQGYLVVHEAFDHAEVQAALDGLNYLISGQNAEFKGIMFEKAAAGITVDDLPPDRKQDYVRKFMWFVEFEARLKAMSAHPQLIEVLTRMVGGVPILFQDMALIKPPKIGREKPWHQDHAYFNLELQTPVVGVWIALDEATPENGCMVIVPGSHKLGPVVHFQRRDWQICDTDVNSQGAVAVPLKPGGCLFFHSLLHHGTPTNNSHLRRRAVQFHYKPAGARDTNPEDRLAVFGEEGKDVTC